MNKHFEFVDNGYYTDNGCSCCEPSYWPVYSCTSHSNIECCDSIEELERTLYTYVTGEDVFLDSEWDEAEQYVSSWLSKNNVTYAVYEWGRENK